MRWRACTLRLLALSLAALLCTHFSAELKRKALPQPGLLVRVPPKEPGAEVYNRRLEEVPSKRQVIYVRRSGKGASPGRTTGVRRRDTLQPVRWHIDLQPWAGPSRSLEEEARRFLHYITKAQITCSGLVANGVTDKKVDNLKPWTVCLDNKFSLAHQIRSKQCRVYSLGLGKDDNIFEFNMASGGCEVHRFDPSIPSAYIREAERFRHHRLSVDWRDPKPAIAPHRLHSNTKKLKAILNEFGHWKIDVLKADMESAEWKILENIILEGIVEQIGQLVLEIHLHWPGFEVGGNDSSVVRYWYSLFKELEYKNFRLFHTYKDVSKPQMFLKKEIFNASSCYILSWVNTRWT
ncbi:methyltransferase-like protein 24 isoform X1 [Bufo gargarizans]|uniref:methyltransferase-like protein 24 isoform X1 n=2 Tax=Bufo gargarizans TaxID=30331 RepID=UPI001CF57CCE|nr:methyltransferase-like protein 24 isoform X1 [Bufo gargarizans]